MESIASSNSLSIPVRRGSERGSEKGLDPEFFAEVARRLGVPPMAILVVGNDYKKDIVPAKAVGMRTAFVTGEEDPGSQDAADVRIPSLTHIPRLVREWGLG
jgi:FMN phosphatase YigB (HAD superfamily)